MTTWQDRLTILQGDITLQPDVDAIVNAANEQLSRGGGVCGAIHAAAGPRLAALCADMGHCATGAAVATPAFDLPCRFVIHAVGPRWGKDGGDREDALLASCYLQSLRIAADLGCERVAFPSISTGIYGFPVARAARVALEAIREGLAEFPDLAEVRLICFSAADRQAYEEALAGLD